MPVSIEFRFESGRFHATPWGHHVNEGLPEWPPSPWRILRALVATWRRKFPDDPELGEFMPVVLGQLASAPPVFDLPAASLGHTRHFMPLRFPDQGDRTKVFDAFVSIDPKDPVVATWPDVTLDEVGRRCLGDLLANLGYLGRAESWCSGTLVPTAKTPGESPIHTVDPFGSPRFSCRPLDASPSSAGTEPVRVLVPDPNAWDRWSFGPKVGRPTPAWNLLAETADLHAERWSDPPGSRWVTYLRPNTCFQARTSRRPAHVDRPRYSVARYALDGVVLPLIPESLRLAEKLRLALMSCYKDANPVRTLGPDSINGRISSVVFSGKDAEGGRLRQDHAHAFYLPTDEDNDGRVDHLTVVASMGFGAGELRAIDRLRSLWFEEGQAYNLLLVGLGTACDMNSPVFGPSQSWVSATPFVAPRHPKARGAKRDRPELLGMENREAFLLASLRDELDRLQERRPDVPPPTLIEALPQHRIGARKLRPIQFRRFRKKASDDGGRRPCGAFRITFPEPVRGPLCLGHSSHFGLGLFLPEHPQ